MAVFDYDIGVIGAGAAGLSAAAGAARFGAKVLLIEAEKSLGGDCLHYGCVPSKTLIHTANLRWSMLRAERFGLAPCAAPPADMALVAARIREVVAAVGRHDSVERFEKLGVEVAIDRPVFMDEHTVRLERRLATAAKWIIATGSSPVYPGGFGLAEAGALTNREIFSLTTLPARLAVLGAGPVAVEMAQAFARLGSKVTIVHRGQGLLKRADPELAALLGQRLKDEGVVFAEKTIIKRLNRENGVTRIEGLQEDKPWTLDCEAALAALGRAPNVAGLGLEKAGVKYDASGVAADDRLRATQKHIFACGDVRGKYLFTHAAGYEAGVAVANAVLRLPRKVDYRFFPWAVFTGPELAQIGMGEEAARRAGIDFRTVSEDFSANDRAQTEGVAGRIKILLGRGDKPLGVHILGPRAGELICEWAAVLGGGLGLTRLAGLVHPYPTFGEINKTLAGKVVAEKLFSPNILKLLKFFFGLRGKG
ncbi:MAG: FAD-dependent oxidoreductase [Desulfovibrionaceae bacterium]|nr:FAD-dependent oxidoreductase [Desulfovibrionaceae bacterium]